MSSYRRPRIRPVLLRIYLNYIAVAGDYWNFFLANNITGWNTLSFDLTGSGSGLGWEVDPTASGEELLITGVSQTPIPSTVFLLGSGIADLAALGKTIRA